MRVLWLVLALLGGQESGASVDPPAPTAGLADLHLHQWGEGHFAGGWLYGEAAGPVEQALAPTPLGSAQWRDGAGGRATDGVPAHAAVGALGRRDSRSARVGRGFTRLLGMLNESDDTAHHAPAGPSTRPALPHWLGWPTSDSIAHQQAWEGWMRLAHEGMPLLWYLRRHVLHLSPERARVEVRCAFLERHGRQPAGCAQRPTVPAVALEPADQAQLLGWAVEELRGPAYAENLRRAASEGHGGLQLAVVSLVHFRTLCSVLLTPGGRADLPTAPEDCRDTRNLRIQAEKARSWIRENDDWVMLAETPADLRRAWDQGKLAIVLGVEASDLMDRPEQPVAVQLEELLALGVRVVQPVHEYDNRFGGAAPVNVAFDAAQGFRTRQHGGLESARDPHAEDYVARRHALAEHWESRAFWAARPRGAGAVREAFGWWSGGSPWGFGCAAPGADPRLERTGERCFTGAGQWRGLPNRVGLTAEGRELVRRIDEAGGVVDVAHLSHRAIAETLEVLDAGQPVIHSHALPAELLATTTEHHQPAALLAALAARGGMVGLRTADDALKDHVPVGMSRVLGEVDCEGTSTDLLAMVDHLAQRYPELGLGWGSDLNGFINQVGPTGQLRRDPEGRLPCGALVPSIGSEVQRRGLAHIGLLPSLVQELWTIAEVLQAPAARQGLEELAWGAETFARLWERLDERRLGVPAPRDPVPLAQVSPPVLDPRWELPVPVRLPAGGEAVVSLPLLAAIESVLPYVDAQGRGAGWAQLPTTLGLELGVDTPVQQPQPPGFWQWISPEVERQRATERAMCQGRVDERLFGGAWGRSFLGTGAEFQERLALALDPPDLLAELTGGTAPRGRRPAWVPAGEWSRQTLALRRCAVRENAELAACVDDPACLASGPWTVPAARSPAALASCGDR